ncbi:MAG TPA: iron-sulfur cluster repair di-iron protein [Prolixibacteraceae bacterium]|nr:iron-sulfur cluster repair di-iron protein [Prolixibacteraceae bacterium]
MNQVALEQLTVGEIVTNDFRTSLIFKNAGIDFCCGGNQTLKEACTKQGINQEAVLGEIEELNKQPSTSHNFKEWEPVFLSDYIVNTHHKFVLKHLPELLFYTQKIADVHGGNHRELKEVATLFKAIHDELGQHLKNEEEVLFPAIKEAVGQGSESSKKTIISEIERMFGEHDFAGGAMDKINTLTNGYQIPEDACKTYEVALKLLGQFEDDLHVHVHLENNILFPKALELAKN